MSLWIVSTPGGLIVGKSEGPDGKIMVMKQPRVLQIGETNQPRMVTVHFGTIVGEPKSIAYPIQNLIGWWEVEDPNIKTGYTQAISGLLIVDAASQIPKGLGKPN